MSRWLNGISFGLNDLEALLTVTREAKEWISTHASNSEGMKGSLRLSGGFLCCAKFVLKSVEKHRTNRSHRNR